MRKLKAVYFFMNEQAASPTSYKDHPLRGDWKGWRDLHIEPDWLLLRGIEGA
ncbi:MAG: type II toxin-antitoxin system mRNA interferase toxin, RelE/StbE family [Alphaproteobacteria bacterium]|nr:type II toxin-antitoxin system mRNA interferase toxin, RelE/StbE family [Alphaproteobacteria bacterium]